MELEEKEKAERKRSAPKSSATKVVFLVILAAKFISHLSIFFSRSGVYVAELTFLSKIKSLSYAVFSSLFLIAIFYSARHYDLWT